MSKKISQLDDAAALTGPEQVPIVQNGETVKTTVQAIANLAPGSSNEITSGTITTSGGTLTLDFASLPFGIWRGLTSFATAKAVVLDNTSTAVLFDFTFEITNVAGTLDFGSGSTFQSLDSRFNASNQVLTLTSIGTYTVTGRLIGTSWWLDITSAGGNGVWGSITGTLSSQTDLQNALNAKLALAGGTMSGNIAMGANKVTGLAAATTNGDAVRFEQLPAAVVAASETASGIAELATQAETDAGTDDLRIVTPLKLRAQFRRNDTKTANYTVAQSDEGTVLRANSASAIAFDFPSLTAGTIVTIVNINAGDVTWTNSGGTSFVGGITVMPGGTLMSLTFIYRSTTVIEILGGMASSVESLAVTLGLSVKAGLSAGTIAKVGGIIHNAFAAVGNVGTGEDTLLSFPLPANTLSADGMSVRLTAYITFAANANNKTLKVKFGATTGYDSTALAINNAAAFVRVVMDITRTGAATQMLDITITPDNSIIGTLVSREIHTTSAETLSGSVNIIITGEATTTNDIVKSSSQILFFPTA